MKSMSAGQHPELIRIERRVYTRQFSRPMPLGQARAIQRNGLLLRLQQGSRVGYGECTPLPDFGSECFEEARRWFSQLPDQADKEVLLAGLLNSAPPASAFALESALIDLENRGIAPDPDGRAIEFAALCELDDAAPATVASLVADGFRRIKLKVGRSTAAQEIASFNQLARAVPDSVRFRLDPNRLWSPADWRLWCDALEGMHAQVEFIEEPVEPTQGTVSFWSDLAAQCPVPLALDEWLGQHGDSIESALASDWAGWLILKPAVLGASRQWLAAVAAGDFANRVVISSAFESAIGAARLLRIASMFPETAHGLGTQSSFGDGFGCHVVNNSIHLPNPARLDFVWDKLGTPLKFDDCNHALGYTT